MNITMLLKCIVFVFAVIIGVINAAPVNSDLKFNENRVDNGQNSYKYQYELEDGQKQAQMGYFKYVDADRPMVWVVEGFYSFIAPDGKTYKVTYIADENGYRAIVKDQDDGITPIDHPYGMFAPPPPVALGLDNHLLSLVG